MKDAQHQNESLAKIFGETLKKARGYRSQAEFARELGILSQATYQRYEAGRIPDGDILFQIATRLGVTMEELLTGGKRQKVVVFNSPTGEEVPVPWGFELEENVQLTVAISAFTSNATVEYLVAAAKRLITDEALGPKAKAFWKAVLTPWISEKIKLEEFEKLSPAQKLAAHILQNQEKAAARASSGSVSGSEKRLEKTGIQVLSSFVESCSAEELRFLASAIDLRRLWLHFEASRDAEGFFVIEPGAVLSAVSIGLPPGRIKLRIPGKTGATEAAQLTAQEFSYLNECAVFLAARERGEKLPLPDLRGVGRIPAASLPGLGGAAATSAPLPKEPASKP